MSFVAHIAEQQAGPLRVLIADDHAPTRDDVRRALTDGGLVVCAEAADAARAVQQALETRPDICLLDVRMPGGGVAAAWEIAARLPTTKVVMLTVSDEDGDLFRALRAGAVSYLVKDIDFETPAPGAARGRRRKGGNSPRARRSHGHAIPLQRPALPHDRGRGGARAAADEPGVGRPRRSGGRTIDA